MFRALPLSISSIVQRLRDSGRACSRPRPAPHGCPADAKSDLPMSVVLVAASPVFDLASVSALGLGLTAAGCSLRRCPAVRLPVSSRVRAADGRSGFVVEPISGILSSTLLLVF